MANKKLHKCRKCRKAFKPREHQHMARVGCGFPAGRYHKACCPLCTNKNLWPGYNTHKRLKAGHIIKLGPIQTLSIKVDPSVGILFRALQAGVPMIQRAMRKAIQQIAENLDRELTKLPDSATVEFLQGAKAFKDGVCQIHNPYEKESDAYNLWLEGWKAEWFRGIKNGK